MSRTMEINFQINANLSGNFNTAMKAAANSINALKKSAGTINATTANQMLAMQKALGSLWEVKQNVTQLKELNQALQASKGTMREAQQQMTQYQAAHKANQKEVDALKARQKSLAQERAKQKALAQQLKLGAEILKQERARLKTQAGITRSSQLKSELNKAQTPERRQQLIELRQRLATNAEQITENRIRRQEVKVAGLETGKQITQVKAEMKPALSRLSESGGAYSKAKENAKTQASAVVEHQKRLGKMREQLQAAGYTDDKSLNSAIEAITRSLARTNQRANTAQDLALKMAQVEQAASNQQKAREKQAAEQMKLQRAQIREQVISASQAAFQSSLFKPELGLARAWSPVMRQKEIAPISAATPKIEILTQAQKLTQSIMQGNIRQPQEIMTTYQALRKEMGANQQTFQAVNRETARQAGEYRQQQAAVENLRVKLEQFKTAYKAVEKQLTKEAAQGYQERLSRIAADLVKAEANLKVAARNYETSKASGQNLKSAIITQREQLHQTRGQVQPMRKQIELQRAQEPIKEQLKAFNAEAATGLKIKRAQIREQVIGFSNQIKALEQQKAQSLLIRQEQALSRAWSEIQRIKQQAPPAAITAKNSALTQMQEISRSIGANKANTKQVLELAAAYKRLKFEMLENRRLHEAANQATAKLARTYQQQQRAVDNLKGKLEQFKAAYKGIENQLSGSAARGYKDSLAKITADLAKAEANLKVAARNYEASKVSGQNLKSTLQAQQQLIHESRAQLQAAGIRPQRMTRDIQVIERVQRVEQRQAAFNQSTERLSNEYQNYQQAIDTARTIMSPFTDAVQTSMEFEATMSTVKALTQSDFIKSGDLATVNANMAKLTATAERLGATTKFTATQAAQGEVYLAYSGWDTDQINAAMPAVLNFAMAGNLDMANAARIMSNVMMAAKLAPEKSMHAADVLSYAVTHSNQDAFTLGETLKYSVPVAMQFGSSFEEAVAMTKPLADAGITGSMAGTSLRATMLRMIAPPKQAAEALEQNALTLDDANKAWLEANAIAEENGIRLDANEESAGRQMANVLRQMNNEVFAGKTNREKLAIFNAIVGRNAVSGAVNLFDWGSELVRDEETGEVITRLEEFTRKLEEGKVDGYSEQTAKVTNDNLKGDVVTLNSAYENMQIQIGRALSPTLRQATQFATDLVHSLSNFIVQYPQVAQAAATIAAGISSMIVAGAGLKLLGAVAQFAGDGFLLLGTTLTGFFAGIPAKIAAAVTWLTKLPTVFMAALRAGMAFAFSPIGAAMLALAALALVIYKNWDKLSPVFSKLASIIGGTLTNAFNTIAPAVSNAMAAVSNLLSVLGKTGAGEMLAKGFVVALGVITGVFQAIMEMAANLIALLADVAKGAANITSALKEGDFSGALKASNELVTDSYKDLKGLAAATGGLVTNPYNNAVTLLDEYEHGGERRAAEVEKQRLTEYKAFLAKEQERHGAVEPSERLKERQAVFAERRAQEEKALRLAAGESSALSTSAGMAAIRGENRTFESEKAAAEKQAALKTALVQNAQVGAGYNTQAKSYVVADHSEVDLKNAKVISNWQPPEPKPEPRWQLSDSAHWRVVDTEYLRHNQRQMQYQAFNDSVRNALTFKGSQAPDDYNFNELQAFENSGAKWFQEFDFSKLLNNSLDAGLTAATSALNPQNGLSNALDALSSIFFSKAGAATPESVGMPTEQISALGAAAQVSAESLSTNAQALTLTNEAMTSGVQQGLTSVNENVQQAAQGMTTFGQEIGSMVTNMQSVSEQTQPAAQAMEQMSLPAQQSAEALQELPASIQTTNEALTQSAQSTQTINESITAFSTSLTTISEGLTTSLTAITENLSTALTSVNEQFATAATTLSESLTSVNEQFSMAATAVNEGFAQLTMSVSAVNQETVTLTASYAAENAAVVQLTAANVANAAAVSQSAAAANASAASLNSFTAAVNASVGGVSALSSSASSAAGSVSMLGSAAAMAVASMNSAAANISAAAASLPAGSIAQNAKGGIYNHGAFLTWFAEKSPEAAIPLDGSDRAIGLWLQAGEMLGLEPAQNYSGGIYNRGGGKVNQSVSAISDNFSSFESAVDNLLKASKILAATDFANVDNSAQMQTAKQSAATNFAKVNNSAAQSAAIVNPRRNQIPTLKEIMTPESVKSQRQAATTLQSARELAIPAEVKQSKSYQALQQVQRADVESMSAPREVSYGNAIGKLFKGDVLGAAKAGVGVYKKNAEVKAGAAERPLPQINTVRNEQAQASVKASSVSSESASKNATDAVKTMRSAGVSSESASKNATNAVKTMRSAGVSKDKNNKTGQKHVGGIWGRWFGHKSHRYDELGNIKDLNGLPENVITASDSRAVIRDKKIAQEREASEKGFTRKHTGGIFGRMWNSISGGQSVGDALRNVIAPAQTAASIVTSDGRAQQLPMTPGTISQSKPSLIQKIMTPESVKSQQSAATTLNNARSAVMSDEVKQSKSYQALQQVQRADVNSMAAPQQAGYGNAIGQLLKGDVWGAAKSAAGVYKNNLEVKAGAAERPLPATALPQMQAAQTTKMPPAGTVEQSKIPLYTMSQARVDTASMANAQTANSLQQVDSGAPHLEELTAFENETSQMGGEQTSGDMQVTFNVTINTQETAAAIPQIQDEFESKMREWLHERQRRGYQ